MALYWDNIFLILQMDGDTIKPPWFGEKLRLAREYSQNPTGALTSPIKTSK